MPFLQYEEPSIVQVLIVTSFFVFLSVSEWLSSKILRAGILGPIVVGIIYGEPLANILLVQWQQTFLALGYVGLILIIFEGGLATRLDLLKQNFVLSCIAATTGVILPISLSFLLIYLGYGYSAMETFIVGAALSSTSLGTTFAVISSASSSLDLVNTRVGSVLSSAAVVDDVIGLVMSSVIRGLGRLREPGSSTNLGWLIGRPIVASIAMAALTPVLTKFVLAPIFRRYIERRFARYNHMSNIVFMTLVLSAFISIAAYAGTSVLLGAFLAGTFLKYLPSNHPSGPFVVLSREHGEQDEEKSPTFVHTWEKYLADVQRYLMEPLFFASMGFAVPFLDLWTGKAVWRGILFALLMVIAKALVGIWVVIWDVSTSRQRRKKQQQPQPPPPLAQPQQKAEAQRPVEEHQSSSAEVFWPTVIPASMLLGSGMVARGEIGLLIIQIGYNQSGYVSEAAFITGVWAILLNTIVGPVILGALVKRKGTQIAEGRWGLVKQE